jgi:hypothetical protein
MNPRKPNPNNPLNRFSEDRAAEVGEFVRTHTLAKAVAWLASQGVKTRVTALSDWYRTWSLQQQLRAAELRADRFKHWLAESFPKLSQRELDRRANVVFQTEAMEAGDARTYLAFNAARHKSKMDKARLEQRERAITQHREQWFAAQKSKIEAGLDALYLEVKDNAEARELFQKFKTVVTHATT